MFIPSKAFFKAREVAKTLLRGFQSYYSNYYTKPGDSVKSSPAWEQVDAARESLNRHQRYWWRTSGKILALLLDGAGYTFNGQKWALEFFLSSVVPCLGIANVGCYRPSWKSFMTDDGGPIELSWDWTTPETCPKIRYSIEPVSLSAGTKADLYNTEASKQFHKAIIGAQEGVCLEWFNHFHPIFWSADPKLIGKGSHSTQIFYAFDLQEDGVIAKVYFVPNSTVSGVGKDRWLYIADAVKSAPLCQQENLQAMTSLDSFFEDFNKGIEIEMLAIDLIKPSKSRIKIYFRSQDTSFASIVEAMTLNGRINGSHIQEGINNLQRLWKALFGIQDKEKLAQVSHRTAGILYYAEFKLGSELPSIKLYIPVRHYAPSDAKVLGALSSFLEEQGQHQFTAQYAQILETFFNRSVLESSCGIHTYLGCTIRADGSLRLISYLNPQFEKIAAARDEFS